MIYVVTMVFFLLWSIWAIRKGCLSWHTIINLYMVTLLIVDVGDVSFDHWFNFYDIPTYLLNNPYDLYMGIIFSDGMIFPLIAIVFCYYSVRYRRPWVLSIVFALLLGIIEVGYVKLGYMVYYQWNHWLTPGIIFILCQVLACFSDRFVYYSPPIPYRLCLLSFVYGALEWPGAIMGGVMRLYNYRPHLFDNELADDRFTAVLFAVVMGGLIAYFAPRIRTRYKLAFFLSLGLLSTGFAFLMFERGWLIYHQWNHLLMSIRYIMPYILIYLYDSWESNYRQNGN
ncbi:hypothetical protein SDC9_84791 [bioreactor metagenome]|uniref:Uncharacterized protein n=1 Tax=bioreactor metagenome TaxID=1076179 RepID=A0A644ZK78_9ZZZZ